MQRPETPISLRPGGAGFHLTTSKAEGTHWCFSKTCNLLETHLLGSPGLECLWSEQLFHWSRCGEWCITLERYLVSWRLQSKGGCKVGRKWWKRFRKAVKIFKTQRKVRSLFKRSNRRWARWWCETGGRRTSNWLQGCCGSLGHGGLLCDDRDGLKKKYTYEIYL